MTIRLKILSLAFLILIIFGVVLGISTSLQHDFIIQIDALTRYHIPLRTLIARFDVLTYEYELITMRLLRRSDITPHDIESGPYVFGRFRTVSTRAREAEWELGTLATDNIVRHSRRAEITTLHEVSWMCPRVSSQSAQMIA
jgi:hypothetical protein